MADGIKQADGNPSFHNETLRDMLTKASSMKSRWLEKKIKEELPGVEVIAGLPETPWLVLLLQGEAEQEKK